MKLTPILNKVLIEKEFEDKVGSIYIPDECVPESTSGKVIAIGEKVTIPIQLGDTVYFPKYTGLNFTLKGNRFFMIEQEYVILNRV